MSKQGKQFARSQSRPLLASPTTAITAFDKAGFALSAPRRVPKLAQVVSPFNPLAFGMFSFSLSDNSVALYHSFVIREIDARNVGAKIQPNEDLVLNRTAVTPGLPRPAPLRMQLTAYFRAFAVGAGRLLLRPQRRDSNQVAAEYDQGAWRLSLDSRGWTGAATLADYLFGDNKSPKLSKLDGRIVLLAQCDYTRRRYTAIADLLSRFGVAERPVVELGCGPGSNLLYLAEREPARTFEGYDISPIALEVARTVQAHFGIANASFGALDMTNRDSPAWRAMKGKTVLTYFALEQMPDHIEGVVAHLLAARPRRVIHVEPSTELLSPLRPLDWPIYFHVRSKDYQRSLFGTLRRRAAAGEIRLLHKGRLPIAPSLSNDGFVAVWEPTAAARL